MKFNKETYRNFEKNLWVYMSPEAPPVMDYQKDLSKIDRGVRDVRKAGKDEELLKGQEFNDKRKEAEEKIKKIDLDAKPETKTDEERKLEDKLIAHNKEQFNVLEHNYRRAVLDLGESRKNENSGIVKAEVLLYQHTNKYLSELEVHIFQKSVEKGNLEARGMMIEQFLENKGIALKGIGKYLAEALGDTKLSQLKNCKTKEEIYKKMEEFIDDKAVLKKMVERMEKDLPKFEITDTKKKYFMNLIDSSDKDGKNRLAKNFGDNNKGYVSQVLAMRFSINFAKTTDNKDDITKPQSITDLATNTTYKPDSPEWKDKLRSLCHDEMKDFDDIKKNDEGLHKLKYKQESTYKELKDGTAGPDWEVHKLSRLKDNPLLTDVLRTTTAYQEAMTRDVNDASTRLKSRAESEKNSTTKEALNRLAKTMTPEKAREAGLMGSLAKLLQMIHEALGGKNPKSSLDQIHQDIEANKNPVEMKNKVMKMYEAILKNPKSQPKLAQLLDPAETDDFFKTEALKQGLGSMELASRYPEERVQMVKDYLMKNLGVDGLGVRLVENKYVLAVKKGNLRSYIIEKGADGYTIQRGQEKPQKLAPFTLDALKKIIAMPDKPATPAKAEVAEKTDVDCVKEALGKMITNKLHGTSALGKLIKDLGVKDIYNRKTFNKLGKTGAERQNALESARVTFIIQKMNEKEPKKFIALLIEKSADFKTNFEEAKKQPQVAKQTPETKQKPEAKITTSKQIPFNFEKTGLESLFILHYNAELKLTFLTNQLKPNLLFGIDGKRIGYVSEKSFVFADPPGGWKKDDVDKIPLSNRLQKKLIQKRKSLIS